MILTRELIKSCATWRGKGFSREQLQLLGVSWPPRKGWLSQLAGSRIDEATFKKLHDLGRVQHGKAKKKYLESRRNGFNGRGRRSVARVKGINPRALGTNPRAIRAMSDEDVKELIEANWRLKDELAGAWHEVSRLKDRIEELETFYRIE